jgi:hypothetical protein
VIRHVFSGIFEPRDSPYGVPVIVKRRIGKVLLKPVIDNGIENYFFFAESSGAAKMIHGNEDPNRHTRPPHVAGMKSLKNPHIPHARTSARSATREHCEAVYLPVRGGEIDCAFYDGWCLNNCRPRRMTVLGRGPHSCSQNLMGRGGSAPAARFSPENTVNVDPESYCVKTGAPECSEVTDVTAESVELRTVVLASLPKTSIHEGCLTKDGEERDPDLPQERSVGALNAGGEAAP